jgi:hypothetical protein
MASTIFRRARAASSWLIEQALLVLVLAFGASLAVLPVRRSRIDAKLGAA